jgi:hypothetical protein
MRDPANNIRGWDDAKIVDKDKERVSGDFGQSGLMDRYPKKLWRCIQVEIRKSLS